MRLPSEETMPDDIPLAKLTVQCTLIIVTGDEDPDEDPACGACGACGAVGDGLVLHLLTVGKGDVRERGSQLIS